MIKCNAQCEYQINGECILHPDKVKLIFKDYDKDFNYQLFKCNSQHLIEYDRELR